MRIGQILLQAELITPQQLSDGLEYAGAKSIFLGKALKLLKFVNDEDVERVLHAQKLMKMGLSPVLAIEAIKRAATERITIEQALQDKHIDNIARTADVTKEASVTLGQEATAEALLEHGDKLLIQDRCTEAADHYQRALSLMEKIDSTPPPDLTPVLLRLGNTYLATHSFEQSRSCYEKVLSLRSSALQDDHPLIAQAHESLADLYNAEGDTVKAVDSFLGALDILEKNLPAQLSAYASILRRVAAATSAAKEEARTLPIGEILKSAGLLSDNELQTALRMSKQQSLPLGIVLRENCMVGDRELQSALKAQFCVRQGVLSEQLAIDLLMRAIRRDISLERLLHEAGVLVSDQEKFEIYRQIASDLDKLVAAESSAVNSQQDLAPVAYRLGESYERVGDPRQAEVYYSRALSIWGSTVKGDLTAAKTCISLAKILEGQNRKEEVVDLLKKALELQKQAVGTSHESTISTMESLSEAHLALFNSGDALKLAETALQNRRQQGQEGEALLRAVVLVGDCLLQMKSFDGARDAYKMAMSLAQPTDGRPTATLAAVMEKQGDLLQQQGLFKVAAPLFQSAKMILEAAGKKDTKAFASLERKLTQLEQKAH
jgi:tetratricopeptide (TPR) repeat protein